MTEAAKRDLSVEDNTGNEISSDDPLFELSQIMGFSEEVPVEPSLEIDPQIDLEDALLAEMAVEPEIEPAVDSVDTDPTIASLEDELATMLGGTVSVASEVAAPIVDTSVEEVPVVEAVSNDEMSTELAAEHEMFQSSVEPIEPVQYDEAETQLDALTPEVDNISAAGEFESIQVEELDVSSEFEPVSVDVAPVEEASVSDTTHVDAYSEQAFEPVEETPQVIADDFSADLPDSDLADDLENDFAAFFDEELPSVTPEAELPRDPVEDLVAQTPEVEEYVEFEPVQAQEAPISASDNFEAAASEEFNEVTAQVSQAPVLETTDMSAYETANPVEVDVPDLPDLEDEFVAAFDDDIIIETAEEPADDGFGAAAAAAALGATVTAAGSAALSRRAGEEAMATDEEAFDETRFEAELARDMEFVTHDLSLDDEPSFDETFEGQEFAAEAAANRPAKKGLMIAAILGCVAIAGAVGVFAFSGADIGGTDGPVLVEASSEPIKVAPENPGGKQVPNQDRAVFAEKDAAPIQEELVSGSEEPVDIAAIPQTALPSAVGAGDLAKKGEDRLAPNDVSTEVANGELPVVTPRKVRTLVVKPDGTLVERAVVPTPKPIDVAAKPAKEVAAQPIVETAPVETSKPVEAPQVEAPQVAAAPKVVEPVAPKPAVPTRKVQTNVITPTDIAERPNNQPLNIVNQAAQNTQVAAAPAAPEVPVAPAATPYSVQLASLPSQDAAQRTANSLSRKLGGVIGGRGLSIRKALIEGKGTFYRVRVGANNRADANQLCGRIKSAGGDCFVTR